MSAAPGAPASRDVVVATSNPGKLLEIREILRELDLRIDPLADFPGVILPVEGDDYEDNAIGKARAAAGTASELPDLSSSSQLKHTTATRGA